MKRHWMFLEKGEVRGPVTTKKLLGQIQQYKLSPLDFIRKKDQGDWLPATDFPELSTEFKSIDKDADWVILSKQNGRYVKKGLFSTNELKGLLQQRTIKIGDFIWRSGLPYWCRIYELEIFKSFFLDEEEDMTHCVLLTQFTESTINESQVKTPPIDNIFSEKERVLA